MGHSLICVDICATSLLVGYLSYIYKYWARARERDARNLEFSWSRSMKIGEKVQEKTLAKKNGYLKRVKTRFLVRMCIATTMR